MPFVYYEPKLGKGFAYCPSSGGIFELEPAEIQTLLRREPATEYTALMRGMRSYTGRKHTLSDFISHLTGVGIQVGRLSFPVELLLELTRSCNLRCRHCYVSAGAARKNELTTEEWAKIIESFASGGGIRVVFTGGEPLIHTGFLELVRLAKAKSLGVSILTNGTLLDRAVSVLSELLRPGVDLIQVSLDGMREEHDYVRGEGSFNRAVSGIRAAVGAGLSVQVATTVTPYNRGSILDLYEFVADLGVSSFKISPGVPIGRLDSSVTYSAFLDLCAALRERSERVGLPVAGCDLGSPISVNAESLYTCKAGVSSAYVDSTGNVFPCPLFHGLAEFQMGNLRRSTIREVWLSPGWERLRRDLSQTKCASCPLLPYCRGGCPFRAYLEHGTVNAPSPLCRWSLERG